MFKKQQYPNCTKCTVKHLFIAYINKSLFPSYTFWIEYFYRSSLKVTQHEDEVYIENQTIIKVISMTEDKSIKSLKKQSKICLIFHDKITHQQHR